VPLVQWIDKLDRIVSSGGVFVTWIGFWKPCVLSAGYRDCEAARGAKAASGVRKAAGGIPEAASRIPKAIAAILLEHNGTATTCYSSK